MLPLALGLLFQIEFPQKEDFEKHIRWLASDEMKGRDNGTPEGLKAADYVAGRFRAAGLKPGGKDGYFHDFASGRNVVGLLEGENGAEFVVVAAHHDARGVVKGRIQNGADDNASGVAMVLELARSFSGRKPARSMLFISFDTEEDGLVGSREFVKSGLYDVEAVVAMFVFDLIGGDLFPWEKDNVYALGTEASPELAGRVERAARDHPDLKVGRTGVYLLEPFAGMARSDYGPFRDRRVPFVFFSTGTPWYYHTEHDDPEVINYPKMVKAAKFVRQVIAETAADPKRPAFRPAPDFARDRDGLLQTLRAVWKERDRLTLTEEQKAEAQRQIDLLSNAETPDAPLLQKAMMFVFTVARSQGKP